MVSIQPHKIKKICYTIVTIFLVIIIRLIFLQVSQNPHFLIRGQQNFLRVETIIPIRGNILDRNGKLLATNRPLTSLYWHGTGNTHITEEQEQALTDLAKIININIEGKKSVIARAELFRKNILIYPDLSYEQLSKISEKYGNNENLMFKTTMKRFYPYQSNASHIVGYLSGSRLQQYGQCGLEKHYESILCGTKGTVIKSINSFGNHISQTTLIDAIPGNNIITTLDIDLQTIVEKHFPKEHTGAVLLMDPEDGSLLSVVSRPHFDPTIFLDPISHEQWNALQKNRPFLNRAYNTSYPPGSIFKLITISTALEQNIITEDTTMNCKGYSLFGKRKYWCHCRHGHGKVTTQQALAQSCNVPFYEIGKNISVDALAEYAFKFGLGQPTGFCFPEKIGLVPSSNWKLEEKGERWWAGETLSVTIGQSFLLVTPLQVARMIGSIFTGYLVNPRICKDEPVSLQSLEIKSSTKIFLQNSMQAVITQGTGRRLKTVKDITIYAKTSTAQVSSYGKRTLDKSYLEHGWFVCYLQYKDNRPLVMVILVENAGTSRVPTIMAKKVIIDYKQLMDKS